MSGFGGGSVDGELELELFTADLSICKLVGEKFQCQM